MVVVPFCVQRWPLSGPSIFPGSLDAQFRWPTALDVAGDVAELDQAGGMAETLAFTRFH